MKHYIFPLLILICSLLQAQEKYTIKNYSFVNVHEARNIVQLDDGGYMMYNAAKDYTTDLWNTYFFTLDSSLNLIDVNFAADTNLVAPLQMIPNEDKTSFLVCGSSNVDYYNGQANPYIVQYNRITDSLTYGVIGDTTTPKHLNAMVASQNTDNIICVGYERPNLAAAVNYQKLYVLTLSPDLTVVRDTFYTDAGFNYYFTKIIPTQDGNYMLLATTNKIPFNHIYGDIRLMKINELGDILWEQDYDFGVNEETYEIIQTQDGGYVFCTIEDFHDYANSIVHLVKIDAAGVEQWHIEQQFFVEDEYYIGYTRNVIELNDGSLILSGHDYPPNLPQYQDSDGLVRIDATIVKLNADGVLQWQRIYHSEANDYIYDMILEQNDPTGKSGFVLCGRNDSTDADYAYLLKLNCMGLLTEPQASFTHTLEGLEVYLQNTSQYVYPDSTDGGYFTWQFGDGTTSNQQNPTHTYAQAGSYPVTLTAIVCNDTSTYTQIVEVYPVGVNNDGFMDSNCTLAPIPNNGWLNINCESAATQLAVYTLEGRLVQVYNIQNGGVNTHHLDNGYYIYQLKDNINATLQSGKLVIIK